jgi:hypothetical protein
MGSIAVLKFPAAARADETVRRLRELERQHLIELNGATIVFWPDEPTALIPGDVEEFPLLLRSEAVNGLIEAARQLGLTPATLARRIVSDFLRQPRTAQPGHWTLGSEGYPDTP